MELSMGSTPPGFGIDDEAFESGLIEMARQIVEVPGVDGVVLGGSRARGTHRSDSDVDLGIYYSGRGPLDLMALNRLAGQYDDGQRSDIVCPPGGWGPWVNAGGWLTVQGMAVDWILRDTRRVEQVIDDCLSGRVSIERQPGHPFGFVSAIYLGELAVCRPLADPRHEIVRLKGRLAQPAGAMARGIVQASFWEVGLNLSIAAKALSRGDTVYLCGCAFRAITGMALSLCALNGAHWLNEKGAVDVVEGLPIKPLRWRERVAGATAGLAACADPAALEDLRRLCEEVRQLLVADALLTPN